MVNHPRRSRKIAEDASFHEGDIVTVYNQSFSGRPLIEGKATIVGPGDVADQYKVRFHNLNGTLDEEGNLEKPTRRIFYRFVYPGECQEHPNQYLAKARAEYDAQQLELAF